MVDRPGDNSSDEELRAIGVFARVRHAQQTRFAVLQFEILIGKLWAVNGFTTSSYSRPLAHNIVNEKRAIAYHRH